MKNIRWILFDLGNVLYDIDVENTFQKVLSFSSLEKISDDEIKEISKLHKRAMTGKYTKDTFFETIKNKFRLSISIIEIKKIWNEIIVGFREEFRPLLNKLKTDYKVGLLSNTDPFHYEKVLRQVSDFNDFFDRIFLSHEMKSIKPNIKIYKLVLEQLNMPSEQILFFDDSPENVESAKKTGINAFCVNNFDSVLTILKEYHILVGEIM
ncbi:MAG: HAD family phosphatase [Calditrichia bacterium]|nr:HAD family phosphatase [Calditrichia bacterium]